MRIEEDSSRSTSIDYVARANRAIDHVIRNLDQPLQLESVAQVAGFSPFHFHRIFRSLLGETLSQFVKRLRLERALAMLSHGQAPSLTEVALACGFTSSSDFSRSFKQRYGVPPSAFDVESFRASRRKDWQAAVMDPHDRHRLDRLPAGSNPDGFEVQLRELPARRVAYVRVLDPYRPHVVAEAIERFVAWAEERDLADGQWLGYMWDDPELVAHEKCRYDAGVEVPADFAPTGEIGCLDFPAMQVAEVAIRGTLDLEMRAIDWFFRTWLPTSGFVPTDQPCFEVWMGRPFAHGKEYFELFAQIPVARE